MIASPRWLIANWKMNGTLAETRRWVSAVDAHLTAVNDDRLHCVFCPPFAYLHAARDGRGPDSRMALGGQNCHEAVSGPLTGEISAPMLADVGATYVILGHSERRAMGEDDARIAAKVKAALSAGLTPIICVGESRSQYEAGATQAALSRQLALLADDGGGAGCLIAYEPIWAIGTGKTPKREEISSAHRYIKSVLGSTLGVLYGGSVDGESIAEIIALPEVFGVLIGGASLNAARMIGLIDHAAFTRKT